MPAVKDKKVAYGEKLVALFAEFKNVLLLKIDNVGSRQMQEVRIALRGRAVLLMGKNTIIRRVIRNQLETSPHLSTLLPHVRGNIGFCFTNDSLAQIRKEIVANTVPAAASTGMLAPVDVIIPAGPTGLDPGQTAFFQALNIGTKINRGSIELINKVHLVKENEKVSASAVALLTKLGMKPFHFGVKVTHVWENGFMYQAHVLDLTQQDLTQKFFRGVGTLAALSLALGYPTLASLPHSLARGFRTVLAIALTTDYIFEEAKIFKEMLDNPDAFKVAAPAPSAEEKPAPAPEPEPEPEEEEAAPGGGLFDEEGY